MVSHATYFDLRDGYKLVLGTTTMGEMIMLISSLGKKVLVPLWPSLQNSFVVCGDIRPVGDTGTLLER